MATNDRKTVFTEWHVVLLVVVGMVALLCGKIYLDLQVPNHVSGDKLVRGVVEPEELILKLTPRLKQLDRAALNLKLPDHFSRELFAGQVAVLELDPTRPPATENRPLGMDQLRWGLAREEQISGSTDQLQLWKPFFETINYCEYTKFSIVRGELIADDEFAAEISFSALAETVGGQSRSVKATQHVTWRRSPDDPDQWHIVGWQQASFETTDRPGLLFRESLDDALRDQREVSRARESVQEQLVLQFAQGEMRLPVAMPAHHFELTSSLQHPGLSVVDVDSDGLDDLYVMRRWGRNLLFHNQGGGHFKEAAARFGLDINGACTGAVFADFDNDGDQDVILARSIQRTMYLVNDGGRFVDRSQSHVAMPLPFLASSVSAADYNGDGLLDIYLCRYALEPAAPLTSCDLMVEGAEREFKRRRRGLNASARFLQALGPPNVLLVNSGGGRFAVAKETSQLARWFNSFQSSWSDFDEDGDPDLYVTNDFAPDFLYRNDGPDGFVDITEPYGGQNMMGFGMGASWGDYDNDGRLDLYVSNMFSKAGRRIMSQLPDIDPRFRRSAEGNLLFRNQGERFDLVSGVEPPHLTVAQAGWSWGGQFTDVDNDGFLDIYVTSGYYTAPAEVDAQVDL